MQATFLVRCCPICGSAADDGRSSEFARHGEWRLVRCSGCDLVYMPETPTADEVETDHEWLNSFHQERMQRWMNSPFARFWTMLVLGIKPSREGRAMRRIARIRIPPARMLDVGAGDGRLAAAAMRWGFEVACVELSPAMAAKALRRLKPEQVLVGRLEDVFLSAGDFDLVTAVSFLEHEPAPLKLLQRVHGLLRASPPGQLVVKVPNHDCLLRRLRGRRWSGYRWPEHVQYFTTRTLSRLVQLAGFRVDRVWDNPFSDNLWLTATRVPASESI